MKQLGLRIKIAFAIMVVMVLLNGNLFAQFAGGNGTEENPWQIETAEQLDNIRNYLGAGHNDKHFILRANIDLGVAPWNVDEGWEPIAPDEASAFFGYLNGNGYVIKNLTINRSTADFQGLFGNISGESEIKNLGLLDVDIIGNMGVGAFAAYIDDRGKIERCYATGRVEGFSIVGGIAGWKGGETNQSSFILDSYSNVHVVANGDTNFEILGGIVGLQFSGDTHRCYAIGMVELAVPSDNAGAVIGHVFDGNISNLYWNMNTTGQTRGVGNQDEQQPGSTTLQLLQQNTYRGFDFNTIWDIDEDESYAYLRWQGQGPEDHNYPKPLPPQNLAFTLRPGLVNLTWEAPPEEMGIPDGYNVYRNRERINQQLIEALQYQDEGVEDWVTYTYYVTAVRNGEESPPSAAVNAMPMHFAGGDGTDDDPYQIATASQLSGMSYFLDSSFIQIANIDISGIADWEPIGNSEEHFQGKYNGDGYEIQGLRRENSLNLFGFFGYLSNATIENVNLTDVNVYGGGVSGIVAANAMNTRFENCSAQGTFRMVSSTKGGIVAQVSGNTSLHRCWVDLTMIEAAAGAGAGRTGGIVGLFNSTGSITECFALVDISWGGLNSPVGGLIGQMQNGSVSNSYVVGTITTTQPRGRVGGFIGDNSNRPITNCYALVSITSDSNDPIGGFIAQGAAANVTSCYWNTEISGVATSPGGGQPLTTAQMFDRDNFVNWEFEGDDPIWRIAEGSIPYLAYEGDEAPPIVLPPTGLEGTVQIDTVRLTWERPAITPPVGYNVYRDNRQINQALIEEEEYRDNNVESYTPYAYHITAVYEDNAESAPSHAVNIVTHDFEGEGTADNPYLISNARQLNAIRYFDGGYFRQTDDIDLGVAPWNVGEGWKPIGEASPNEFKGTYDGNDFVISSLTINTGIRYVGLFGYTSGANLRNITLEDVNIVSRAADTGALVGRGGGTIANCSTHGEINGTGTGTGGLAGYSGCTMTDSYSSVTVNSPSARNVGGLIGENWGTMTRCWATGDVTGDTKVGGLCGMQTNGRNMQNYATGRVVGNNEVGGLYGHTRTATHHDEYAMGDVVGNSMVGGMFGNYDLPTNATQQLFRGYSIGRVTGQNQVGGLIGRSAPGMQGPFNSYWNTDTSEQRESAGGEARSSHHMIYPYTEDTYVTWDFNNVWTHDVDPSWNGGYPRLHWQERPMEFLEAPQLKVDIVQIDGTDHFRIRWELVDGARSYMIYSSQNPSTNDWGDPIEIVGEDVSVYIEPIGEHKNRFFYVTASSRNQ